MNDDPQGIADAILAGEAGADLADRVVGWPGDRRIPLVDALSPLPAGRRWLRSVLLPRLNREDGGQLARLLVRWQEDFDPGRRDRTTPQVVRALNPNDLLELAPMLAGGNAAGVFWERVRAEFPRQMPATVMAVLQQGSEHARETTLHLALAEGGGEPALGPEDRRRVLLAALDDSAEHVRGLAADLLLEDAPQLLLERGELLRRDGSERVRMAAWDAALALEPERAAEDAVAMVADEEAPVPARRTALVALGSNLPTREVAPLLALVVGMPQAELAEDAANLLWAYHRTPVVAEAAARSPHASVRAVAERLLHPDFGSPAAGGSRPGAPGAQDDFYGRLMDGLADGEREGDSEEREGHGPAGRAGA